MLQVPEANWVYKDNDSGLNDIDITEDKVSAKLLILDKAAGADDMTCYQGFKQY